MLVKIDVITSKNPFSDNINTETRYINNRRILELKTEEGFVNMDPHEEISFSLASRYMKYKESKKSNNTLSDFTKDEINALCFKFQQRKRNCIILSENLNPDGKQISYYITNELKEIADLCNAVKDKC